jgi:hypothetical protein
MNIDWWTLGYIFGNALLMIGILAVACALVLGWVLMLVTISERETWWGKVIQSLGCLLGFTAMITVFVYGIMWARGVL